MTRRLLSSASTVSSAVFPRSHAEESPQFNIWNLISRGCLENSFCMTSKFRNPGKPKVHRIRYTTIHRNRSSKEPEVCADVTEAETEEDEDLSDFFDEDIDDCQDLVDLYKATQELQNTKHLGSIITESARYNVNRPFSGVDMDVIGTISETGTVSQKVYLKKCVYLQTAPSNAFVKKLSTAKVKIAHQNVGPSGAQACAVALAYNTTVTDVDLSDNAIGHRGAKYLAYMLRGNTTIRRLKVADNDMRIRGAKYLVNVIMEVDKINKLDLSNNGLKDEDAEIFKHFLEETRHLQVLNLSRNYFRERGGELLGEGISYNDSVTDLNLSWNHIRRDGAVGIVEGLMDNTCLKRLNLAYNGFGLEGCLALEKSLSNNVTLEEIDLTNNRITRECIGEMNRALARNTTLRKLVLKFNPMTVDGVQDLLQFIADTPSSGINHIDLGIHQVDPLCKARINEVHIQDRKLKVYHGEVIGALRTSAPEIETVLLEQFPSLVLIEYGKLMEFRLLDLFTSLDKDGSRTLDREEIKNGLMTARLPFSDKSIDKLIEKLDTDHDGLIDFSELLTAEREHKRYNQELLEAEQSGDHRRLESTTLWKIRKYIRKLTAERISTYDDFKDVVGKLSTRVKHINEELQAKTEAATQERARKPRQVRSRPASSKASETVRPNNPSTTVKQDNVGNQPEDVVPLKDATKLPDDKQIARESPTRMRTKRNSVQLPVQRRTSFEGMEPCPSENS